MLTQSRLKELFDYCPDTGIFVRKVNRAHTKKGDIAGCLSQGYYKICIDRVLYLSHRLAWLYVHGTLPEFVDHINRVPTDNRIENLRSVTRSVNCHNIVGRASSGEKGVTAASKDRDAWEARIMVNRKSIYLGFYKTKEEATAARKGAELALRLRP